MSATVDGISLTLSAGLHIDSGAVRESSFSDFKYARMRDTPLAVQQAWIDCDVAQCGFCQAGQIMAAAALLRLKPKPTDADIDTIENVCRCGAYYRIRLAIKKAAAG